MDESFYHNGQPCDECKNSGMAGMETHTYWLVGGYARKLFLNNNLRYYRAEKAQLSARLLNRIIGYLKQFSLKTVILFETDKDIS